MLFVTTLFVFLRVYLLSTCARVHKGVKALNGAKKTYKNQCDIELVFDPTPRRFYDSAEFGKIDHALAVTHAPGLLLFYVTFYFEKYHLNRVRTFRFRVIPNALR